MKTNKSCLLIAAVLTFLFTLPSTHTLAQDISTGDNNHSVESNTSTTSKSENRPKYNIPSVYKEKFESMLKNEFPVIKIDSTSSWKFTVEFIDKEMESDWGISKDNQFLFVLHSIHRKITGKDLLKSKDVLQNKDLFQDFSNVLDSVDACGQRYYEGMLPFVNKQIAENKQKIAENKQKIAENKQKIAENKQKIAENNRQIAENKQRSAEAITSSLDNLVWFYNRYKKNPSTILEGEIKQWKELCKKVVSRCKEENIDYKAKLSKDMLKFYEIE